MVVILCVALLVALTLIKPKWALIFIFASFSFEQLLRTRSPDVVSAGAITLLPPIRFSQIVVLVLCGMMVAIWIRRLRIPRPGVMFGLFTLYSGICLASLSYSSASADSNRQFIIIALIGITVVTISWWIREFDQARVLIRALYWGVLIHCLWALFQLASYVVLGMEIGYYAPGMGDHLKGRVFGWMFEPNWFGVLLVVAFPWYLLALDYGRDLGISRRVAIFGLAVLSLAILLNMSRLAWLAISIQLLVWVLVSPNHLYRYIVRGLLWSLPIAFGLTVLLLSSPSMRAAITERFIDLTLLVEGRGSANVRIFTYNQLWSFFVQRPWLGYGVGTWASLTGLAAFGAAPTTTFLYMLVETGIVGAIPFILLITILLVSLTKAFIARQSPERMYLLAAGLGVIGMIVTAWFVDIRSVLSYFPVLGLTLALLRLTTAEKAISTVVNPKVLVPAQTRSL
jgi:O-antigen ligase